MHYKLNQSNSVHLVPGKHVLKRNKNKIINDLEKCWSDQKALIVFFVFLQLSQQTPDKKKLTKENIQFQKTVHLYSVFRYSSVSISV